MSPASQKELVTPIEKIPYSSLKTNVDQDGEWRTRKITLMGVVRSFVSQLRPGQDLTRVSLPAVLLHPYSLLEVVGYREMSFFEALININSENDPVERMMIVLRWYLATLQQEQFHKKPYNPVQGETHLASIDTKDHGTTQLISEQVSHHPPISALVVQNLTEQIFIDCNVSFGVKFGGNYVSIVTDGAATLNINKLKEVYEIPKRTPDMVMKNVVIGTRRIYWSGDVSISCPKTKLKVSLSCGESGSDNYIKGFLYRINDMEEEEEISPINGILGEKVYLGKKKDRVILDFESIKKPTINYLPPNELDPLSSIVVWADVSKNIIDNDMDKADEAKKQVEQQQRDRIAEKKKNGTENEGKHFELTEQGWVYKKKAEIERDMHKKDKKSRRKSTTEEIPPLQPSGSSGNLPVVQPVADKKDEKSKAPAIVPIPVPPKNDTKGEKDDDDSSESGFSLGTTSDDSDNEPKRPGIVSSSSIPIPKSNTSSANTSVSSLSTSPAPKRDDSKSQLQPQTSISNVLSAKDPKKGSFTDSMKLSDDTNILTGWVKMRNSMKIWNLRWFALRPGKLIYYKDDKDMVKDRCMGILQLNDCTVKERPTNKDGFSFKIFHLLHYPIYAKTGLKGETLKTAMLPVSWSYCILRVNSETERKTWMDAIANQIEFANYLMQQQNGNTSKNSLMSIDPFSSEDEPLEDQHSSPVPPISPVAPNADVDDLFLRSEELQAKLMSGLSLQQQTNVKAIQKKTMKIMDEWKKELDTKIETMEKRILVAVNKSANAHPPASNALFGGGKVNVNVYQFVLILALTIFIGKLISY